MKKAADDMLYSYSPAAYNIFTFELESIIIAKVHTIVVNPTNQQSYDFVLYRNMYITIVYLPMTIIRYHRSHPSTLYVFSISFLLLWVIESINQSSILAT